MIRTKNRNNRGTPLQWLTTLSFACLLCTAQTLAQDQSINGKVPETAPLPNADAMPATAVKHKPSLPSIDYRYNASFAGIDIGQVEVTLDPAVGDGDDCYRYSTTSNPSAMVRALYGSPNEVSQFCVKDGRIVSQHFNSVLPGNDKQSYTLNFDWQKLTVTDANGNTRSIPADAVDSFALQQAVRLWVVAHTRDAQPPNAEFTMVDHKNLTHYILRLAGHESVQTPAGTFDALKMERIDNPKKTGIFWLAPERNYMPVRIETQNGNRPAVILQLAK